MALPVTACLPVRFRSSEWQVAYLFYLLSILVAGVRVPEVSALTPGNLLTGIEWTLSRDWVDDKTKKTIASARQRLQARAAG